MGWIRVFCGGDAIESDRVPPQARENVPHVLLVHACMHPPRSSSFGLLKKMTPVNTVPGPSVPNPPIVKGLTGRWKE